MLLCTRQKLFGLLLLLPRGVFYYMQGCIQAVTGLSVGEITALIFAGTMSLQAGKYTAISGHSVI